MKPLYKKLRLARISNGHTIREVCASLGRSESWWYKTVAGGRRCSEVTAHKVARYISASNHRHKTVEEQ